MLVNNSPIIAAGDSDPVLERLRPFIDETIEKLGEASFREDPIAGRKYSRVTSIMSSAYKRHAQVLDRAILESLKECSRLKVWREDDFRLSHESLREFSISDRIERCLSVDLVYGDKERTVPVDIIVFDQADGSLRSYNVKRGNGSYDGGTRRLILQDLVRTHMHLRDYGRKAGIEPLTSHAHIIFFYGVMSLNKPFAINGSELDTHFGFPILAHVESINDYFRRRLHHLIDQS